MDILFEIGLEEIPARFLRPALKDIEKLIKDELKEKRVSVESIKTNGTPRRLLLNLEGVNHKQEDLDETNIGPAKKVAFNDDGVPTKACLGFAKSQGVEVSELDIIETDKGEYIGVKKFVKGQETINLLPSIFEGLVKSLTFQKSMKWGSKKFKFVRPIRWLLAIADTNVIEFEVEGIKSGRITRGHRFFGNQEIEVASIKDYFEKIRENNVIIDINERKESIVKQIKARCTETNERVHIEEVLLDEVANLVEYPYPIVGSFNTEFLEVPQEVLIISMQVHQRYFPILDSEGKLLPKFVVVRNGIEDSDYVKRGNETVIGARLSDARFFYNEDLKRDMEEFVESLKTVVFQKDLGTIFEKIERAKKLGTYLLDILNNTVKLDDVLRTIHLAKADLMSNMIGEKEFTKLQGFMGNKYALKSGEKESVALGIEEHYLPRYQGDSLPTTIEGAITGIVDKIDTLVGCFGIGLIPSGSKDPYALRRATLGIVNVILNSNLTFSIEGLVNKSAKIFAEKGILKRDKDEVVKDVLDFFKARVINVLVDKGYRRDIVNAVVNIDFDNIVECEKKIVDLNRISEDSDFVEIVNLLKRVGNIAKDGNEENLNKEILEVEAEINLYDFVNEFELIAKQDLENNNYEKYFREILKGKEAINNFFDNVMVMDKDEKMKNNRLALLKGLDRLFKQVANITELD